MRVAYSTACALTVGIAPGSANGGIGGAELDDLRAQVQRTGGDLYGVDDGGAGQNIVDEVLDDQASTLEGVPELVVIDHPGWPFRIGVLALWGIVFLAWRAKL